MPSTGSLTKQLALPLLAAAVSYVIGWQLNSPPDPARETDRRSGGDSPARHESPPGGNGASSLLAWSERITAADASELPALAKALLDDSRRHDSALWAPLLARWSAGDGAGMISFLESEAPPSVREYLLEQAWFAWGASDPDAAHAAGEDLNALMIRQLLAGVAETDPRKAADFARRTPDAQFVVASLAAHICNADPELAQELLTNAVYGGARLPFQRTRIAQLAATDPAGAIAYAESLGVMGHDPVPGAVVQIARIDPIQAAAGVEAMPRNRTRALSAVELAKSWAAQDLQAAAAWARENLDDPVRHHALVAAADGSTAAPGRLDWNAKEVLAQALLSGSEDALRALEETTRANGPLANRQADIASSMVKGDPLAALKWAESLDPQSTLRKEILALAARQLASSNPDKALALLAESGGSEHSWNTSGVLWQAFASLASRDPADAAVKIRKLPAELRADAMSGFLTQHFRADADAAITQCRVWLEDPELQTQLPAAWAKAFSWSHGAGARDPGLILDAIPALHDAVNPDVLSTWTKANPEAAAGWISQRLEDAP